MSTDEKPETKKMSMTRILLLGAGIAMVLVVIFLLIYYALENTDIADFPQLILAFCIPPILLTSVMGIFLIVTSRKSKDS